MNRHYLRFFIIVTFAAGSLFSSAASYTTSKGAAISVDPIDLINGRINLTYEKKLNTSNSLTINGSYWIWEDWLNAFGAGASYRWYFDLFEEGKSSMNGLSVGPRVDIFFWSYDYYSVKDSWITLAIGGEVNYKWTFNNKWIVEPTLKFTFPILKDKGYDYYTNYGFGVNLGMAF